MLFPQITASEKRKILRDQLKPGRLLQFPGAWAPCAGRAGDGAPVWRGLGASPLSL